jgi:hypothetical protein
MGDLDRMEANLEAAIAAQDARHAAEDGRDVARERCIEAMACAAWDLRVGDNPLKTKWKKLRKSKWDTDKRLVAEHIKQQEAALDAALASGYVVRPR